MHTMLLMRLLASVAKMTKCGDTYCKCAYTYSVADALTSTDLLPLLCLQLECHLSILCCNVDAQTMEKKNTDTSLEYITHLGANV